MGKPSSVEPCMPKAIFSGVSIKDPTQCGTATEYNHGMQTGPDTGPGIDHRSQQTDMFTLVKEARLKDRSVTFDPLKLVFYNT